VLMINNFKSIFARLMHFLKKVHADAIIKRMAILVNQAKSHQTKSGPPQICPNIIYVHLKFIKLSSSFFLC